MPESTFTFRVDSRLKEEFAAVARRRDINGSQLLRDFMRRVVKGNEPDSATYDAWFRDRVQQSLDDPRPAIPNETVEKHFARLRASAIKRHRRAGR
jgi:antitoxin component of RelBE/YafQ-DinJ toxin-antitoxin module